LVQQPIDRRAYYDECGEEDQQREQSKTELACPVPK
jgi:hypothetical protein